MKILFRRAFTKDERGYWVSSERIELWHSTLNRLWYIPDSAKIIWLSLYDRPGKNRCKSKIENDTVFGFPCIELEGKDDCSLTHRKLDKHIEELVGKTVHVEIITQD